MLCQLSSPPINSHTPSMTVTKNIKSLNMRTDVLGSRLSNIIGDGSQNGDVSAECLKVNDSNPMVFGALSIR